jgi:hypothetical protein
MIASSKFLAAALMAVATPWLVAPAAAMPISSPLGLHKAVAPQVETVAWRGGGRGAFRGGGYRGGGFGGAGIGLGLAAGAIIGAAVYGAAAPYGYYGDDSGYAYEPGYDQGYVGASPYGAGGGEVAYCQQRFRSYDPASGTYLGVDGVRHPCP